MPAGTAEKRIGPHRASAFLDRHARRKVNEICQPPRHEAGPDVRSWAGAPRVAVMVHWSDDGRVSRSVSQFVQELARLDYRTVVASTCEAPGPLQWPHGRPEDVAVYRRPNVGIDFGTWGAMLTHYPVLRTAQRALLVNDSMLGPFSPIDGIVADFESAPCDVWGLVSTNQMSPHFQSHFVGYKDGILTDAPLAHFWSTIRLQPTKEAMIKRYERGLYPLLQRCGYRLGVGFPWQQVVQNGANPTIMGWRRLLDLGFPWVKRELLWRPYPLLTDAADVAAVVRQRFGQDIGQWA